MLKENKKLDWREEIKDKLEEVLKHAFVGEALDIGAGKGRVSLFLAQSGFKVTAIDLLPENLKIINELVKKNRLEVSTQLIDVRNFEFLPNKYSLVVTIAALDFLKKLEIEIIIKKIKESLISGGVIYFSVFSTKDIFFNKMKKLNLKEVENNTFYLPKSNFYRHFFTLNEIRGYFKSFEIIYLEEKEVIDTSHGEPHSHYVIEIIAKK